MRLRSLLAVALTLAVTSQARAQDAAAGEKAFAVCRACHQVGPNAKNAVGPVLNGVVGRKAASYPDYSYSEASKASGLTWDVATLQTYLANPQGVIKGTKMMFPGVHDPDKVNDLIAYLQQYKADGSKVGAN